MPYLVLEFGVVSGGRVRMTTTTSGHPRFRLAGLWTKDGTRRCVTERLAGTGSLLLLLLLLLNLELMLVPREGRGGRWEGGRVSGGGGRV